MVGFDPDDPPLLAVQGKVSADLLFFRGCSPPPCSNTTYHSHLVKATDFCREVQKEIGIVSPVCTAMRTATCSNSALGKPAFFSAARRFRMPQKSMFLSCITFSFYIFSDGTNTDTVRRGVGVSERRIRHRERMKAQSERGERRETSVRVSAIRQKNYGGGRSKACWSGPCRFHHLFSPIRHYFPD